MIGKENLAAKVIESGGKLSVKSALNPILWLCAIITIPGLCAMPFIGNPIWLIILIISPVFASIFGFFYLIFFDRDKLQSEEYQLKKMSLEIIQEKGDNSPKIIDINEIEAIEDPINSSKSITERGEK